jgi:hypothetical protein
VYRPLFPPGRNTWEKHIEKCSKHRMRILPALLVVGERSW